MFLRSTGLCSLTLSIQGEGERLCPRRLWTSITFSIFEQSSYWIFRSFSEIYVENIWRGRLVFISFDVTMRNNFWYNPFLKWRKITFLPVTFYLIAHISDPLLTLVTFVQFRDAFLKFWKIHKSNCGSMMAAIRQSRPNYFIRHMTSSLSDMRPQRRHLWTYYLSSNLSLLFCLAFNLTLSDWNCFLTTELLKVILEDLPEEFAKALRSYNEQVTKVFRQYLTTVAAEHESNHGEENRLPLSGIGETLPH